MTKYIGDWRGAGEVFVPLLGTSLAIDGTTSFKPDSTGAFIRTVSTGQAMMLTYSDSGRFVLDPVTDSISWEIWDSFGRHSQYRGLAKDDVIIGKHKKGKLVYTMATKFLSDDSMAVTISTTDSEGVVTERAKLNLGRER